EKDLSRLFDQGPHGARELHRLSQVLDPVFGAAGLFVENPLARRARHIGNLRPVQRDGGHMVAELEQDRLDGWRMAGTAEMEAGGSRSSSAPRRATMASASSSEKTPEIRAAAYSPRL